MAFWKTIYDGYRLERHIKHILNIGSADGITPFANNDGSQGFTVDCLDPITVKKNADGTYSAKSYPFGDISGKKAKELYDMVERKQNMGGKTIYSR